MSKEIIKFLTSNTGQVGFGPTHNFFCLVGVDVLFPGVCPYLKMTIIMTYVFFCLTVLSLMMDIFCCAMLWDYWKKGVERMMFFENKVRLRCRLVFAFSCATHLFAFTMLLLFQMITLESLTVGPLSNIMGHTKPHLSYASVSYIVFCLFRTSISVVMWTMKEGEEFDPQLRTFVKKQQDTQVSFSVPEQESQSLAHMRLEEDPTRLLARVTAFKPADFSSASTVDSASLLSAACLDAERASPIHQQQPVKHMNHDGESNSVVSAQMSSFFNVLRGKHARDNQQSFKNLHKLQKELSALNNGTKSPSSSSFDSSPSPDLSHEHSQFVRPTVSLSNQRPSAMQDLSASATPSRLYKQLSVDSRCSSMEYNHRVTDFQPPFVSVSSAEELPTNDNMMMSHAQTPSLGNFGSQPTHVSFQQRSTIQQQQNTANHAEHILHHLQQLQQQRLYAMSAPPQGTLFQDPPSQPSHQQQEVNVNLSQFQHPHPTLYHNNNFG
eukprot:GDKJ01036901.1.p1 GENE.GDKJ01036901.1~~GDKJ01036901.1.p1  ORF type:complete len:568 (-),score=106.54 GDKJ01036901.1:394-1875(-)